jgi:hypothetical protein
VLGTTGWTTSLAEKADKLMSHFFETDVYQSNLYAGNVVSIQYLIEQWNHDPNTLSTNVRQSLEAYLRRYYPNAVVNCTTNVNDPDFDGTKVTLKIGAIITELGTQYSFGYLINTTKSTINEIIRMNDFGTS